MAIASGTMLAIMAGISIVGQLQQGRAARQAADAEARMLENQAAQQRDQAEQEAERIRSSADKARGAARAQLAASGVNVNQGTALTIEDEIGQESERDAYMTLLTGDRQARGSTFAASQAKARGRNAQTASVLGAISTGAQAWKGVKSSEPPVTDGGYSIGQGSAYGGNRRGM
jgi:Tfp pilus assembly protein PilN